MILTREMVMRTATERKEEARECPKRTGTAKRKVEETRGTVEGAVAEMKDKKESWTTKKQTTEMQAAMAMLRSIDTQTGVIMITMTTTVKGQTDMIVMIVMRDQIDVIATTTIIQEQAEEMEVISIVIEISIIARIIASDLIADIVAGIIESDLIGVIMTITLTETETGDDITGWG